MFTIKRLNIVAIGIGIAFAWLLVLLSGYVSYYILDAIGIAIDGTPSATRDDPFHDSLPLLLAFLTSGALIAVASGYVVAWIAKSTEALNTLCFGIVYGLSVWILYSVDPLDPVWFSVATYALIIPCAMLGGYVRVRVKLFQRRDVLDETQIGAVQ